MLVETLQTQRHVRIYDLMKQQLVKTLNPGLKWISSIDIHPLGGESRILQSTEHS